MPATNLEHPFSSEIRLASHSVVELNRVPVRLIGFRQRQGHRRVFLVAPVEEDRIFIAQKPAVEAIPILVEYRMSPSTFPLFAGLQEICGHSWSIARTARLTTGNASNGPHSFHFACCGSSTTT